MTGERILVLLKTFVTLVIVSAMMSLKTSLCDGSVVWSGQRKEEPSSEIRPAFKSLLHLSDTF